MPDANEGTQPEQPEERRARRELAGYALAGSTAMFGVAALSRFIRPGGWAIWPALGLLVAAMLCLLEMGRVFDRLGE
jgi:hypothetical protein